MTSLGPVNVVLSAEAALAIVAGVLVASPDGRPWQRLVAKHRKQGQDSNDEIDLNLDLASC